MNFGPVGSNGVYFILYVIYFYFIYFWNAKWNGFEMKLYKIVPVTLIRAAIQKWLNGKIWFDLGNFWNEFWLSAQHYFMHHFGIIYQIKWNKIFGFGFWQFFYTRCHRYLIFWALDFKMNFSNHFMSIWLRNSCTWCAWGQKSESHFFWLVSFSSIFISWIVLENSVCSQNDSLHEGSEGGICCIMANFNISISRFFWFSLIFSRPLRPSIWFD